MNLEFSQISGPPVPPKYEPTLHINQRLGGVEFYDVGDLQKELGVEFNLLQITYLKADGTLGLLQ